MKMAEFFAKLDEVRKEQNVLRLQLQALEDKISQWISEAWQIDSGDVVTVKVMLELFDKIFELRGVKTEEEYEE